MAEPWESLPDVEPAAASWESLPDVAEEPAGEPVIRPGPVVEQPALMDTFTAALRPNFVEMTPEDRAAAKRSDENDTLRTLFRYLNEGNGADVRTQVLELSRRLQLPSRIIEANVPAWKRTAEVAEFDPERWRQANPEMTDVIFNHPELAPSIITDAPVLAAVKALRAARDWFSEGSALEEARRAGRTLDASGREDASKVQAIQDAVAAEMAARPTTRRLVEADTPEAKAIREGGTLDKVLQRGREGVQQTDVAKLGWQAATKALVDGVEDPRAEQALQDARLAARPLYLAETDNERMLGEAVTAAASSLEGIKAAGIGAAAVATVGAAGGAIAGAATGGPAGIIPGATAGAKAALASGAGGWAVKGAQFLSSMRVEAGGDYAELRELVTDAGQKLSPREAAGAAIASGFLKAVVEVGVGAESQAVTGLLARLKPALASSASVRRLVVDAAKKLLSSSAGEGGEEGVQSIIEQLAAGLSAAAKDGAMQAAPLVEGERVAADMQAGALGGLLMGGGSAVTTLTIDVARRQSEQQVAAKQSAAIDALAAQPLVQATPEVFAAEVARMSAENGGAPVTHKYVSAEDAVRLYQEEGPEAAAKLLGDDAEQQVKDAAATGQPIAVPLERVLGEWPRTEAGKLLLQRSTVRPDVAPAELAQATQEAIQAQAEAIAKAELERQAGTQQVDEGLDALADELVAAGRPRSEARAAAALWKARYRVLADEFQRTSVRPVTPEQLLAEARVAFAKGDEAAVPTSALAQMEDPAPASEVLSRRAETLSDEEALLEQWIDPVTGLRNVDAWDLSEQSRTPGGLVAVITSKDIKALNDHPDGGHDKGNQFLARIGAVIGAADPEAAAAGTEFRLHVADQAAFDKVMEEVRAALPVGLTVEGAVGATVEQAGAPLKAAAAARKAAGTRGQTDYQGDLAQEQFPVPEGQRPRPNIGPEHVAATQATRAKGGAEYFATYLSKKIPGVLNRTAFLALPPAAYVWAGDLKGIGAVNETYGKAAGDQMIETFGQALLRAGGSGVNAAHLSGDEFAAKHDSKEALEDFQASLRAELAGAKVVVTLRSGEQLALPVAVEFRGAIGEKTYGAADQVLNANKRAEKADVGGVGAAQEGRPDRAGQAGDSAPGGDVLEVRRSRAQGRGAVAQAFRDRSPAGPEVVRQDEPAGGVPKGYAELQGLKAFFNRKADASTVIHETAHLFLGQLEQLVSRPDAPERTKETLRLAREALGAKEGEALTREQHETFARSFEQHLLNGEAPTPGLQRAFTHFMLWLTRIYSAVVGVPGANLTPELRNVFDRLLATERELERQAAKRGQPLEPGQADEADEGLRYATRRAYLEALEGRLDATTAWWAEELQAERAAAAQAYEGLQARRAQLALQGDWTGLIGGDNVKAEPTVLDRAEVAEATTEEQRRKLRARGVRTDDGGASASLIAHMTGYPDAKAMLGALAALESKERWVEARAQEAMRAKHPSVLDDATKMRRKVIDGLQAYTERRLQQEGRISDVEMASIRRAAELLAGRTAVGAIRAGRALAAERKAAREAATALRTGDFLGQRQATRRAALNALLYRELLVAQDEREAFVGLADELRKRGAQQRLGKAAPALRDAVAFLLGTFGLAEPADGVGPESMQAALDTMREDGFVAGDEEPLWFKPALAALERADWRQLTVDEMRHVRDALKGLRAAARRRTTVLVDGKRVELAAVEAALMAEAATHKRQAPELPSSAFNATLGERLAALPGKLGVALLKPEIAIEWLGGSLQGKDPQQSMWFKAVFAPLERARQTKSDVFAEVGQPIVDAWKAVPKAVRKRWEQAVDGRALFPSHAIRSQQRLAPPSTRAELFMMLLNAGNESNLKRLTEGRGITEAQVVAALNDNISEEEIAVANSVVDAFAKLWPRIQDLEERLTGVRPKGFEPRPLQLRNGVFKGGYFPVIYDARVAVAGEKQQANVLAALADPAYGRFHTQHGHTKSRAEDFADVVALDPNAIGPHLEQQIHDLVTREALNDVGRLLLRPGVVAARKNALGERAEVLGQEWLKAIGTAPGAEGAMKASQWMAWVMRARSAQAVAALGYLVSNFAEDQAGPLVALTVSDVKANHLAAAYAEIFRAGLTHDGKGLTGRAVSAELFVLEKSGVMRATHDRVKRDLLRMSEDMVKRGPLSRGPIGFIREHAFVLMEWSFRMTATPVWLARYRQALAEGASEADAVEAADRIVRRAWPHNSPTLAPAWLRDRGYLGIALMFHGFMNTMGNVTMDSLQKIREGDNPMKVREVARIIATLGVLGIVGGILKGKGPGKDDDREDWAAVRMGEALLSQVPFLNDIVALAQRAQGKRPRSQPLILTQLGLAAWDAVEAALDSDMPTGRRVAKVVHGAAPFLGLPATQPVRTGQYAYDVATSARSPRNAFDLLGGLAYGESDRGEANPFTLLADFEEWLLGQP